MSRGIGQGEYPTLLPERAGRGLWAKLGWGSLMFDDICSCHFNGDHNGHIE